MTNGDERKPIVFVPRRYRPFGDSEWHDVVPEKKEEPVIRAVFLIAIGFGAGVVTTIAFLWFLGLFT